MARLPRLSVAGWPHLILQLGHSQQSVFKDDMDRALYLDLLREAAQAASVNVHAYALLDGEVRLLATPGDASQLSRMMQSLGRRYGGSFNRRHGQTGTLWSGRFRATVVEPELHLLNCMQFVEEAEHLLRGDLGAEASPWSSAAHHLGQRSESWITEHRGYWSLGNTPFEREIAYRKLTEQGLPAKVRTMLRTAVLKSWPLGTAGFVESLSDETPRRLTPLPRGRPKKKQAD